MNGKTDDYTHDERFCSLMGMVAQMCDADLYCKITPDGVWICVCYQGHFATLLNNQTSRTWLVNHDWLEHPEWLDGTPLLNYADKKNKRSF